MLIRACHVVLITAATRTTAALNFEPLGEVPFGAEVLGLSLEQGPPEPAIQASLELEAARRGFLVFRNQSLPGRALAAAWSGEVVERHTVHEEAVADEVLRLSNRPARGIFGVGPQWHADGAFERNVFSHVLFHAIQMPPTGGETELSDLAAAYGAVSAAKQREWARLATVNAFSGAVHPLVHRHPISGRMVLFAHLGQIGAVLRRRGADDGGAPACGARALTAWNLSTYGGAFPRQQQAMDPHADALWAARCGAQFEVLREGEVRTLLRELDALLTRHRTRFAYRTAAGAARGDVLLLDNLAVAHRAAPSAHDRAAPLRVLHRTTLAGHAPLDACDGASWPPPFLYIWGANPLGDGGMWQEADNAGVGFVWDEARAFQN